MKEFAGKFCFVNPRKISRSSIYDPSELKLRKPWIKESNVCFVWNRTKYNISLKIKVEALQKVKTVWKGEQIMDHSPLFLNYKRNKQAKIIKVIFRLYALILVGYSRQHTVLLNLSVESCLKIQVYMLWFNFILGLNFIFLCFKLIIIHYHTQKQREIKFKPRIKLNHNINTSLKSTVTQQV